MLELYPSPKSHAQLVGLFVEVSVKVTSKGTLPNGVEDVNKAVGVRITTGAETESIPSRILLPPDVYVLNRTLWFPEYPVTGYEYGVQEGMVLESGT